MMSVGRRLTLSLMPAMIGLAITVGLAYYGEHERRPPEWFVIVALISAVASSVLAWAVTRHVARRLERLADWRRDGDGALRRAALALGDDVAPSRPNRSRDELETIERIVDRLVEAYERTSVDNTRLATQLEATREEWSRLVQETSGEVVQQLEQVRLPLHILLENHFGDLNENQEEMLGAARGAAEQADHAALRLRDLAAFDLGNLPLRRDAVHLADLLATIVPGLEAEAARRGIPLEVHVAPALPTLPGDRGRLHEALQALLLDTVHRATGRVCVDVDRSGGSVVMTVTGATAMPGAGLGALVRRVVAAHGGSLEWADAPAGLRLVLTGSGAP
ncbi:MAG: HAMP domain-containing histidine kinase [Gemmatimonadaceae bacterium]|nr:HAMP domain-containing histidine kinase [Gemmatimonadaceae bacterium]